MPTLAEVVDLLHAWYPPATADSWDAVGLVAGDPSADVTRVMFAVDPTIEVAREAVEWGADLLVVHHPLFLTPVSSVAADTPKGRTLHALTAGGCALLTAHTNADQAVDGVSESLALALGLTDLAPIRPAPAGPLDKVVVFVPVADADAVRAAMAEAGAGRIGDYDSCTWTATGEGRFRPLDGATPAVGAVGDLEVVEEARVEAVVPRSRRSAVVRALLAAHPYEEPAFSVVPSAPVPGGEGLGRLGEVSPASLRAVAKRLAAALPPFGSLVRVAGDPDRVVRRVAVCGGAGDSLLPDVAALDVDLYVTSDLRHHPASDFIADSHVALMDVPHASGESLWLRSWAQRLRADAAEAGVSLAVAVSSVNTDPWTFHVAAQE